MLVRGGGVTVGGLIRLREKVEVVGTHYETCGVMNDVRVRRISS